MGDRRRDPPSACGSGPGFAGRPRPGGSSGSSTETGGLLPKDYWPNLQFLSNWMGGTMKAYLRGYPEFFGETPVRDVGLIASEGRMTIPIEDGTPAGVLDVRHHYFEFIPEDQADREDARDGRGDRPDRGAKLLHRADHRRRALPIQHLRPGPLRRLPRPRSADRIPEQGRSLLEPDRREAVRASGDRRRASRPAANGPSPEVVPAPPLAGTSLPLLAPGRREATWPVQTPGHFWPRPPTWSCGPTTCEYANKRDTRRLGPVRTIPIPDGSWAEFQKRRLAQSGGTVEQYKQPHLIPDPGAIGSFQLLDPVST